MQGSILQEIFLLFFPKDENFNPGRSLVIAQDSGLLKESLKERIQSIFS